MPTKNKFSLSVSAIRKISTSLIAIGVLSLGLNLVQSLHSLYQISDTVQAAQAPTSPTKITVPGTSITDLAIQSAQIKDGYWETSTKAASHLESSAKPGEQGNVVIYGHNQPHLFKPLHTLKRGDSIIITNESGAEFTYIIDTLSEVTPDDISAVLPTDHERLTIYTCANFWDSDRLVITANLTSVSSN